MFIMKLNTKPVYIPKTRTTHWFHFVGDFCFLLGLPDIPCVSSHCKCYFWCTSWLLGTFLLLLTQGTLYRIGCFTLPLVDRYFGENYALLPLTCYSSVLSESIGIDLLVFILFILLQDFIKDILTKCNNEVIYWFRLYKCYFKY